jgi:hypothetical protein
MCLKTTYIYDQFEVWSAMYRTDHIYVHVVKFELNVGKFWSPTPAVFVPGTATNKNVVLHSLWQLMHGTDQLVPSRERFVDSEFFLNRMQPRSDKRKLLVQVLCIQIRYNYQIKGTTNEPGYKCAFRFYYQLHVKKCCEYNNRAINSLGIQPQFNSLTTTTAILNHYILLNQFQPHTDDSSLAVPDNRNRCNVCF